MPSPCKLPPFIAALTLFVSSLACTLMVSPPSPTPTRLPTQTSLPSSTSTPTSTNTPTPTLTPTSTLTPTPQLLVLDATPLPDILPTLHISNTFQLSGLAAWQVSAVADLAWSPDSRQLSVATYNGVSVFEARSRALLKRIASVDNVVAVAYHPTNGILAVGSQRGSEQTGYSGMVEFWYVPTWELFRRLHDDTRAVSDLTFTPDGGLFNLALSNPDEKQNSVSIWNAYTWEISRTLRTGAVQEISYSPDGRLLAASPNRYEINIWQINTGRLMRTIHTAFTDAVNALAFSPDGKTIASGHYDSALRLWEVATGNLLFEVDTGSVVESLAFSPDGRLLATGGGYQDTAIQIWDATSGALLRRLEGHPVAVTSLAFSPDSQFLASGSYDGMLELWGIRP